MPTINDWDDAYANAPYIPGGEAWPERWVAQAEAFRRSDIARAATYDVEYGSDPRQKFDLFRPDGPSKGLMVIIHGGYWLKFDKSTWSFLAEGAVRRGYTVAMPSYRLCPHVRLRDIAQDIAAAITKAAVQSEGPIHLAGHSAGGHLATRVVSAPSPLAAGVLARIESVLSISGLHDLRPMMKTAMNETLQIDAEEAADESPALLAPATSCPVKVWVGGAERPEFIRHARVLAAIWQGLGPDRGASCDLVVDNGRHHFDVVDGLLDPAHAMLEHLA